MRQADYVTLVRQEARKLWESLNTLQSLQNEWNALDYGNTLTDENAFVGENAHLSAADVGAVVFDTANTIRTDVMAAGHATNVAKLL